ncbi:NmrA family protein [Hesseltinella vesiculosa]|uniref:NmrA family protein n=1 Tax=Hesseltinella vesiculosa TaxID=101127 RepID=A0A1X2GM81_9FUNG|nr:NmrA family protein [Hesseltinella vesiculosa]
MSQTQPSPLHAIVGITGNQAGATAQHLLANGARVRGISRNPAKATAWKEAEELVPGSLDDAASLVEALKGADSVFFATPMMLDDAEIQMGKNVVDAALQNGVRHLVFASVGIVEQSRVVPHWNTKYEIEQYIRASGIPFTIVRPGLFMDNYLPTGIFPPNGAKMIGMLEPETKAQLVNVDDIGYVVSEILQNRDRYLSQTIELASDYLNGSEMAQIRAKVLKLDEPGTYASIDITKEFIQEMVDFISTHDYEADIPKLKKEFPKLRTWEQFVASL